MHANKACEKLSTTRIPFENNHWNLKKMQENFSVSLIGMSFYI